MSDNPDDPQEKNNIEPKGGNEKSGNLFEVLDDLIFHMNTTRYIFILLIISSIIIAPIAIIMGGLLLGHPHFSLGNIQLQAQKNTQRLAVIVLIATIFVIISIILAGIWLFIGIKEYTFFSHWNKRFRRYMSLKDKIDKELGEE